ncbi:hypothetical protein OROGR_029032 [Orobanche gracilis]
MGEEDEEDIPMDDISPEAQYSSDVNDSEVSDKQMVSVIRTPLSHSLPAHLSPARMKDLRMVMFPVEVNEAEGLSSMLSDDNHVFSKETSRSPLTHSSNTTVNKTSTLLTRKTPLALKEYNPGSFSSSSLGAISMAQQNRGLHLTTGKSGGFELELKINTPVTGNYSRNIVDAALFMGRSFRVGWAPNGALVHSGTCVGNDDSRIVLSSVINLEKVAIDKVTRAESNKVKEELTDFCFSSPLDLHKELSHK